MLTMFSVVAPAASSAANPKFAHIVPQGCANFGFATSTLISLAI
jgi:hypothetical protein